MNKMVGSEHRTVPVHDVRWVADMAIRELRSEIGAFTRSVSDLLLHEPFALGYAIGFAEQASWHLNKGDGEKSCPDYLRGVIGRMLGNDTVAASFVSFAASKQGDRIFEGGYDAGMRDMDSLYLSYGTKSPTDVRQHLRIVQ